MSVVVSANIKSSITDSPLKNMRTLNASVSATGSLSVSQLSRATKLQNSVVSLSSPSKHSQHSQSTENLQKQQQQQYQSPQLSTIQPSRFGLKEKLKPIEYSAQKVLVNLETQVEGIDTVFKRNDPNNKSLQEKISLYKQSIEPMATRIKKPNDFKVKPLRRIESDFQMYKDIFVQPQLTRLEQLHRPQNEDENNEDQFLDSAEKFFQSSKNEALLLQQKNQKQNQTNASLASLKQSADGKPAKFNQSEAFNLLNSSIINATLKDDVLIKQGNALPNRRRNDSAPGGMVTLNQSTFNTNTQDLNNISVFEQTVVTHKESAKQFFDQLILVQPPELPNATNASPIAPGNGYAPSVPLVTNFDEAGKSIIKDLLVRAKAGQQAGDVQKEAHLSFSLGMVYDNQKNYAKAVKHYLKYFTCARLMGDKIGMGLAANRVGCGYFHLGEFEKSIEFHEKNISYSDSENAFAAYYNLGIAQRKNSQRADSISNFKVCLQWARDRDEMESECLSLGQLAATFQEVGDNEQALFYFTDCYEMSKKLRKVKLQLDCLMHITKLLSATEMKNTDNTIRVMRDAIDCAKYLDDRKTASLCLCNLGIMEGNKAYEGISEQQSFRDTIEEWDEEDEQAFLMRKNNENETEEEKDGIVS